MLTEEKKEFAIQLPHYIYGMYNEKFREGYTEEELGVNREEVLKEFPNLIGKVDKEDVFNINDANIGHNLKKVPMLVSEYEKKQASNGNDFLKLKVTNSVCSSYGNVFDDNNGKVEQLAKMLSENRVVNLTGKVDEYPKGTGKKNLKIFDLEKNEEVNPIEMLTATKQNVDDLIVEFIHYVEKLEEPYYSVTKNALLKNWELFSTRSAAKGFHHAYSGGLLKHTLGLLRVCDFILNKEDTPLKSLMHFTSALNKELQRSLWKKELQEFDRYTRFTLEGTTDHIFDSMKKYKLILSQLPDGTTEQDVINPSLIMSSIVFHDMGKIQEYTNPGDKRLDKFKALFPMADFSTFDDTDGVANDVDEVGVKGGHMLFGILALLRSAEEVEGKIKMEDLMEMMHIILSHHGKLEWGSNVHMLTLNSIIVHMSDFIDSRFEMDDETEK